MQNISESISDKIIDLLSDSDKYSLKKWNTYGIVKSAEDMLNLLLILKCFDSDLDQVHDYMMGNTNEICGIYITSAESDQEVSDILLQTFTVFHSRNELEKYVIEESLLDDTETFDEFLYNNFVINNEPVYLLDGRC